MNEKKRVLIQIILKYIFDDDKSVIAWENNDYQIEFWRPVEGVKKPAEGDLIRRYWLTWNQIADFEVSELKKPSIHSVKIASSKWFKVHGYLRAKFLTARHHLKITI